MHKTGGGQPTSPLQRQLQDAHESLKQQRHHPLCWCERGGGQPTSTLQRQQLKASGSRGSAPPLYFSAVERAIWQWRWYSSRSLCLCASDFLPGLQGRILHSRKRHHSAVPSQA